MRVFLDTNVLFSGFHSLAGNPNRVLEAALLRRIDAVVSVDVMLELARNIARKVPWLAASAQAFVAGAKLEVVASPDEGDVTDWRQATLGSDAAIIAAAIAAEVDYFCTGDRRILARGRAGELAGLRVVSPAELVTIVEATRT